MWKAVESDFELRLGRAATTAASSQIGAGVIAEIRTGGEESGGYGAVQVQLFNLRATTGNGVALVDSTGIVLVDAGWADGAEGLAIEVDSLAREALDRALAGALSVSARYRRGDRLLRAAFAPIRAAQGPVVGVIAIEAEATYVATLSALGRKLSLIALMSVIAIAVLATLMIRAEQSAGRLEHRLSRSENLAAMGRLTATLAHEIKNPLAIIRGSAERLKKLEPEAQRMADFVIEESDRLSRTVARYLEFARGHQEPRETGDAIAALDATLDLLEGELEARKIVLERAAAVAAPAPVRLDPESLKQVYLNLILNALDAMPEGGRLGVSHQERHGRIEVAITDEGSGIPPDILKRLGSPFTTTKAKGSGLGLFLTRRLMQTCGGNLRIQSRVGQGTTCVLEFPRTKG